MAARKKGLSARAKAKREKMGLGDLNKAIKESLDKDIQLLEAANTGSFDTSEGKRLCVFPSTRALTEGDFLTREEAIAQEEQILGKRGVPRDESPLLQPLDDEMPDFLHLAAKAGPPEAPLDHLGRKKNVPVQLPAIVSHTKKPQRTVTITRDHIYDIPDLYLAVHILPDPDEPLDMSRYVRMFARAGCYGVKNLEEADLVVFSGGSDVDPNLYGETRHEMTYFDSKRDDRDMEAYVKCREAGIPMFGVCRGAQFLHVMNGGKLYQHVDNHYGDHRMKALRGGPLIEKVSSVHHQMVILNMKGGMEVLGVTHASQIRWRNNDDKETGNKPDVEAFFYRSTGCFGVQGHPEYNNYNRFQIWCLEQINDLFLLSPDYEWEGKRYRMKKEFMIEQIEKERAEIKDAEHYIEHAYSTKTEA